MSRFITRAALAAGALALALTAAPQLGAQGARYDVIIRNGHIVDGTGNPWFAADVAVQNGRIAAIGRLAGAQATRVIDATGLIVSPGYIDLHTHSELPLLQDGTSQSKVRQGVTLDIMGESTSAAPRDGMTPQTSEGVVQDWTDFTGYFGRLEKQGISMNAISHVSAQQIRVVVMGYTPRAATAAEIEKMKALVARSMREGAWGWSPASRAAGLSTRRRSSRWRRSPRRSAATTRRTSAVKGSSRRRSWTSRFASPKRRRFRSTSST